MIRLPGQRGNTFCHIYEGYVYHQIDETSTYRCASRTSSFALYCPGRLSVAADGGIEVKAAHTHGPYGVIEESLAMKNEMRRRARETMIPLKEIFDDVSLDPRYEFLTI